METLITNRESLCYEAKAALVAFKNNIGESYLELHAIHKDGTMGAAQPVSRKFVASLCESLSQDYNNMIRGAIPSTLLYFDGRKNQETLCWYNPPRKRVRHFVENLGLEDGSYHVPGTIYIVRDKSLYVFCFTGRKPDMNTPLLKGPFFNVYSDGRVCTGNVKLDYPSYMTCNYQNVMNFWENVFWNSIDAHTLEGSPSTKHNLIETIKEYKDKAFATKELNEYRTTLSSKIKSITNG